MLQSTLQKFETKKEQHAEARNIIDILGQEFQGMIGLGGPPTPKNEQSQQRRSFKLADYLQERDLSSKKSRKKLLPEEQHVVAHRKKRSDLLKCLDRAMAGLQYLRKLITEGINENVFPLCQSAAQSINALVQREITALRGNLTGAFSDYEIRSICELGSIKESKFINRPSKLDIQEATTRSQLSSTETRMAGPATNGVICESNYFPGTDLKKSGTRDVASSQLLKAPTKSQLHLESMDLKQTVYISKVEDKAAERQPISPPRAGKKSLSIKIDHSNFRLAKEKQVYA